MKKTVWWPSSHPASGLLPQVAKFSLNLRGCGEREERHTLSRAHTPPVCSKALILLEMKSGVIMAIFWLYIPPPLRTAFSPFLSQFLPETLFTSFKQSAFMYKQLVSHLHPQVQAVDRGAQQLGQLSRLPAVQIHKQAAEAQSLTTLFTGFTLRDP